MSPSKLAATQTGTFAGCQRRHDRSQHAGRVRWVRLVAIPQRHPSVVGRILASHASSAVRAAHDREHFAITGDLDVRYRALQYVSTLQHPQRLMISDRHQRIVAHRSRLMVQPYGQLVSGTYTGTRLAQRAVASPIGEGSPSDTPQWQTCHIKFPISVSLCRTGSDDNYRGHRWGYLTAGNRPLDR